MQYSILIRRDISFWQIQLASNHFLCGNQYIILYIEVLRKLAHRPWATFRNESCVDRRKTLARLSSGTTSPSISSCVANVQLTPIWPNYTATEPCVTLVSSNLTKLVLLSLSADVLNLRFAWRNVFDAFLSLVSEYTVYTIQKKLPDVVIIVTSAFTTFHLLHVTATLFTCR